ncbi:hypothetical protein EDB89DRAFT_2004163, partial [Lactarius sanguifluus]
FVAMLSIFKAPTMGVLVHHWYPTPFSCVATVTLALNAEPAHYKVVRTGRTGKYCPGSSLGAVGTTQGYCRPGQVLYGKGLVDTGARLPEWVRGQERGWSLSTVTSLPQGGPGNTTKHRETHIRLVLPVIYPYIQKNDTNTRITSTNSHYLPLAYHDVFHNFPFIFPQRYEVFLFCFTLVLILRATVGQNTVVIIRVASCRTCRLTH